VNRANTQDIRLMDGASRSRVTASTPFGVRQGVPPGPRFLLFANYRPLTTALLLSTDFCLRSTSPAASLP
jgi:hypothetical protein